MQNSNAGAPVFRAVSQAFVDALRRALRVSAENEEGERVPLTQGELANRADVSRSTLAKYLASDQNADSAANPNLDIICRLAATLGVPPAFLLMRQQDWAALAVAAITFVQASSQPRFIDLAQELLGAASLSPVAGAEAGERMGRLFGLLSADPGRLTRELAAFESEVQSGIAATCALPPFGEMNKVHIPALLALCAVIGTTSHHHPEN
ncbi:helix-turn-helix domain-containing protein [Azoarcus sp. TTM-91]|uniref:helix-turn-helix domain-containing protein n=1 Tax=Azoarcus sp. TTM-91 TaxID=2691581 RepID=UPI00145C4B61|nr:helix-turn-helix transcriptional regulator [Azoarcus sp. TTM-91]NMG35833.1 helix-turn-helix domain-containing protein [Azoarcus sp. TTM-91]